jgi:hypothetical protein
VCTNIDVRAITIVVAERLKLLELIQVVAAAFLLIGVPEVEGIICVLIDAERLGSTFAPILFYEMTVLAVTVALRSVIELRQAKH